MREAQVALLESGAPVRLRALISDTLDRVRSSSREPALPAAVGSLLRDLAAASLIAVQPSSSAALLRVVRGGLRHRWWLALRYASVRLASGGLLLLAFLWPLALEASLAEHAGADFALFQVTLALRTALDAAWLRGALRAVSPRSASPEAQADAFL